MMQVIAFLKFVIRHLLKLLIILIVKVLTTNFWSGKVQITKLPHKKIGDEYGNF
jgi:hypothetical protein